MLRGGNKARRVIGASSLGDVSYRLTKEGLIWKISFE